MQGQDKGLLSWHGRPLAVWVLDSLASTCCNVIGITANRHAAEYRALLTDSRPIRQASATPAVAEGVVPDDPDLPERSGPMAGILTALRHSSSDWVLMLPCDTPQLPADLLPRLLDAAVAAQANVAVPFTLTEAMPPGQDARCHHWVCALIHKHLAEDFERSFMNGERKVGRWIQAQAWVGVCFAPASDFQNVNTMETLHGQV
jgi:molybdopterin-guanine dinucleotide biosynthesis protein A